MLSERPLSLGQSIVDRIVKFSNQAGPVACKSVVAGSTCHALMIFGAGCFFSCSFSMSLLLGEI